MNCINKIVFFLSVVCLSLQNVEAQQSEYTHYFSLDNQTFASPDAVIDDPFIVIRSEADLIKGCQASSEIQTCVVELPKPCVVERTSKSRLESNPLKIFASDSIFDYCAPSFRVESVGQQPVKEVWWQISNDSDFSSTPNILSQKASAGSVIKLEPLAETFLNPDEKYYFRVKSEQNSQWSKPVEFKVKKPQGIIDVEFEKMGEDLYEINWERYAEERNEAIEYLVFGSNSLDFIPSVYTSIQIEEMIDGIVTRQEANNNLVAITHEAKIQVPGSLAYYRIIAREKNQLSVPSRLIHVYDHDLIQPRNVLQVSDVSLEPQVIKRVLIPSTYAWSESVYPKLQPARKELSLFDLSTDLTRSKAIEENYPYNTHVDPEIWEKVKPYFLPENHPAKAKLDRMFSKKRITRSPETFNKAGFKRSRPGKHSRIMASSHPELKEYFIKCFSDQELKITSDWGKFVHRIKGAISIRACIKEHGYESMFKVPRKWIYPLPIDPSPPKSSKYLRKNFILVAENMQTVSSEQNRSLYKSSRMTKKLMKALFTIFEEVGLWDSVFAFNVPFCRDGRLAFIDTEYHHKWPVQYSKMSRYFSPEMNTYWERLAKTASAPND